MQNGVHFPQILLGNGSSQPSSNFPAACSISLAVMMTVQSTPRISEILVIYAGNTCFVNVLGTLGLFTWNVN